MLRDFISLIYPHVCVCCSRPLGKYERHVCINCSRKLPKTNYAKHPSNPVIDLFWGKARINHGCAAFHFRRGSRIQKMLHQLKYKGNQSLGVDMGKMMAKSMVNSLFYQNLDLIIPVPLHSSRMRQRGYNQCHSLVKGISQELGVNYGFGLLKRVRANKSQTSKGYYERHKNVHKLFEVIKPEELNNKKVLLIDDVITTGSTLSSCVSELNQQSNADVFIGTFAIAIR